MASKLFVVEVALIRLLAMSLVRRITSVFMFLAVVHAEIYDDVVVVEQSRRLSFSGEHTVRYQETVRYVF